MGEGKSDRKTLFIMWTFLMKTRSKNVFFFYTDIYDVNTFAGSLMVP